MLLDRLLDARRGEGGTPRVIFVRDGRPEQRHETVPQELIDGALISMDLRPWQRRRTTRAARACAPPPSPFREHRGLGEVAEQHGDLLSLALDGGWQVEEGQLRCSGVNHGRDFGKTAPHAPQTAVLLAACASHLGQRMRRDRRYLAACPPCGQAATAESGHEGRGRSVRRLDREGVASHSARSSVPLANRRFGRCKRQRAITRIALAGVSGASGWMSWYAAEKICTTSCGTVNARNGGRPVSISYASTPAV